MNSIRTNIAAQEVMKNLRETSGKESTEFARLSSGERITKAADDPAGLAMGSHLEAQTRGLRQATRNANSAVSLVQTAEGSLTEISNILVRLRELSIQAASDNNGEQERELLNMEYQQLIEEVERISQSTTYNGVQLLNAQNSDGMLRFQVGAFRGEENVIEYDANLIDATTQNIGIDALSVLEQDEALESLEGIDQAINQISSFRAGLGALQSRMNSTVAHLEQSTINHEDARSQIMDTDIALSSSNLANVQVLKQAGLSALAHAHHTPNGLLRLIG